MAPESTFSIARECMNAQTLETHRKISGPLWSERCKLFSAIMYRGTKDLKTAIEEGRVYRIDISLFQHLFGHMQLSDGFAFPPPDLFDGLEAGTIGQPLLSQHFIESRS